MHVAGVKADARTFEHIDPELVGNEREMLVSRALRQGHRAAAAPSRPGSQLDDEQAARALER